MEQLLYWTSFVSQDWYVTMASTETGLCYVGLAENSFKELKDWAGKQLGTTAIIEDAHKLDEYTREIKRYLSGEQMDFTCPLDLTGTPFQLQVWEALSRIPYGETVTYSKIATDIGKTSAVRAVASAIGRNPLLLIIPCHRVVAKNGSLSGYRDGQEIKDRLIRLESNSFHSSS